MDMQLHQAYFLTGLFEEHAELFSIHLRHAGKNTVGENLLHVSLVSEWLGLHSI